MLNGISHDFMIARGSWDAHNREIHSRIPPMLTDAGGGQMNSSWPAARWLAAQETTHWVFLLCLPVAARSDSPIQHDHHRDLLNHGMHLGSDPCMVARRTVMSICFRGASAFSMFALTMSIS